MSDNAEQPKERGPNYDWRHEAEHYRMECESLRALLRLVESSSDRFKDQNYQAMAEIERLKDQLNIRDVGTPLSEIKTLETLLLEERRLRIEAEAGAAVMRDVFGKHRCFECPYSYISKKRKEAWLKESAHPCHKDESLKCVGHVQYQALSSTAGSQLLARLKRYEAAVNTIRNRTIFWQKDSELKSALLREIHKIAQEALDGGSGD